MPKILKILPVFVLISFSAAAQDYMDEIVSASCECIQKLKESKKNLNAQQRNMEIGLCIITAAEPFQKKLKKDHDIDFDKIDVEGEKLGRLIGMKMATVCPEALVSASRDVMQEEDQQKIFSGTVTALKGEIFLELTVVSTEGRPMKFYWMQFVKSNTKLISNYESLKNKELEITYREEELFDARLNEYRIFNVIEEVYLLN